MKEKKVAREERNQEKLANADLGNGGILCNMVSSLPAYETCC